MPTEQKSSATRPESESEGTVPRLGWEAPHPNEVKSLRPRVLRLVSQNTRTPLSWAGPSSPTRGPPREHSSSSLQHTLAQNRHFTLPSTRSVSESPLHLLPFENLFQSNPLFSSSAFEQQLASRLRPLRQLPYQCTCFAAPLKLYPAHRTLGCLVMVPPLPYLARLPRPIWLSSKDAPLKRSPATDSSSWNPLTPPLPYAVHLPHMLSLTPSTWHCASSLWHHPDGHAPAA
eukprot:2638835-Rhodomonas_salina.1